MPTLCIYQRFLPPDPSGAGKQALTLARFLRERDWDVIFLTDSLPEDHAAQDPLRDFHVIRIDPPPVDPGYTQIMAYWGRVARAIHAVRQKFDVLQVHTADFLHVGAAPIARMFNKPALVRSSITGEFRNLVASKSGRVEKVILKSASAFVLLSQELADEYRAVGMPPQKLNLVPNGVDTSIYHPVTQEQRRAFRRDLELPVEGNIIVYHGVFMERKSIHWVVQLLEPHLVDLDLTLLLVGGPARDEAQTGYTAQLRDRIRTSRVRDRIILRNPDPDIHRYLKAADAYVLASTSEGLSNALLEALSSGLVCIASRTSGSDDVIDDGVSGFLFEARNEDQFLRHIHAVFGTSADVDRDAMGTRAAETVRARFSMDLTTTRYISIYERLTSQAPRAARRQYSAS